MGIGYRYGGDKGRIGREYVFDVWRGGRGMVEGMCPAGRGVGGLSGFLYLRGVK